MAKKAKKAKKKVRHFTVKLSADAYDSVIDDVNEFREVIGLKPIKAIASGPTGSGQNFATLTLGVHGIEVVAYGVFFGTAVARQGGREINNCLFELVDLLVDMETADLPYDKYDIVLHFERTVNEAEKTEMAVFDYDTERFTEVTK
ncbi:MAG: hypothetical protein E6R03_10205 [Hyphomicrobiaceae bacterium]|nr:MAG: hypothetical protein E6R03_10205 [Hyphomicrobiaceae bacterium]